MKQCDLCGARDEDLMILREDYQTNEVKDICRACEKVLNKRLDRIRDVTRAIRFDWMRRFISNMRQEVEAKE